jgi:hypothetical protein
VEAPPGTVISARSLPPALGSEVDGAADAVQGLEGHGVGAGEGSRGQERCELEELHGGCSLCFVWLV